MTAQQRRGMAMQVLTGKESISQTAREHQVSRKFVDQQTAKAQQALDAAFIPAPDAPHDLFFWLPVTKSWIRQTPLGLGLTCRASERGIVQFFADHLDHSISPGTVHNILTSAVPLARAQNDAVDIRNIRDAALDELFQGQRPVLAVADVESTDCFLLSPEEHRDADTWGLRLLELVERGFQPHSTIADFGTGLRAGVAEALPKDTVYKEMFLEVTVKLTPIRLHDKVTGETKTYSKARLVRNNQKPRNPGIRYVGIEDLGRSSGEVFAWVTCDFLP